MRLSRLVPISAALLLGAAPIALAAPVAGQHHPLQGQGDEATKALNILASHGYRDYRDFQLIGGKYDVTATLNNRVMHVQVDPEADSVTPIG